MATSKRGGHASIITEGEGQHGTGSSSRASRAGMNNELTIPEVKKWVRWELELSTKQKKGFGSPSSSGNRARIVKGDL